MPTNIPQELFDVIIGNLSEDTSTLKQCSLVSRSFLHQSQQHLFSTILLNNAATAQSLHRLLTESPNISRYIRNLQVVSPHVHSLRWITERVDLPYIFQVLTPHLRAFSLHCMGTVQNRWEELAPASRAALAELFKSPNLTGITLDAFESFPVELLGGCRQLKKLKLVTKAREYPPDMETLPAHPVIPGPPMEPGYLEQLSVGGPRTSRQLIDFLSQPDSALRISRLREIWVDAQGDLLNFTQRAVQLSGRSVECFILDQRSIPLRNLDLGPMRNLHFLSITFLFETIDHGGAQLRNLAYLLQNIPCASNLKELAIVCDLAYLFDGARWVSVICKLGVWDDFDQFLGATDSKYSRLRNVELQFLVDSADDLPLPTPLVERFPLLQSRGILSVGMCDGDAISKKILEISSRCRGI